MIDALGFRGIWGRDPDKPSLAAFQTLEEVRAAAETHAAMLQEKIQPSQFPEEIRHLLRNPTITTRFLSDTVVVAASVDLGPRETTQVFQHFVPNDTGGRTAFRNIDAVHGFLRYAVCSCVCAVLRAAALAERPLAYRGVVAAGRFAIQENFLIGPAIDEAAALMELADASLVWLAPSAERLPHVLRDQQLAAWDVLSLKATVPLRDGRTLRTTVLNPFVHCRDDDEVERVQSKLIMSMSSTNLDVVLKRQHTLNLFRRIRRRKVGPIGLVFPTDLEPGT